MCARGPTSREPTAHSIAIARTADLLFARFTCPPGEPRWSEPNWIGARAHIVLAGRPVWIDRDGVGEQVADRSRVLLYDADQVYRRRLLDPTGDQCLYLALSARFLDESLPIRQAPGRFPAPSLKAAAAAWVQLQVLAHTVTTSGDVAAVEEACFRAVCDLLSPLRAVDPLTVGARDAPTPRIEEVRARLAFDLAAPLRLFDLADEVGISPFHLVRWFARAGSGTPIAYREQLRRRAAVAALLEDPEMPLADLAAELGFASHSHLTTAVRRESGLTPTGLRSRLNAA